MAESDTAIVIGAIVTIVGGFFAAAKVMLAQASKDREADRAERIELASAIKEMAKYSKEVADATKQAALEAKERNGHLGDQTIIVGELAKKGIELQKKILNSLTNSAVILKAEKHDGGLLVKTKVDNPLDVVEAETR